MTTTLTRATTVLTPDLVLGWESTRETRTVLHFPIDSPVPEVTARPAAPRSGTLRLFFTDQAAASAAETAHAEPGPWLLADDVLGVMRYVVAGAISLRSWTDDGAQWAVELGYQEVPE